MAKTLVIASGNSAKLREFHQLLPPGGRKSDWCIRSQVDFAVPAAVEDGLTFVENALLKARQACRCTGFASLADDSGLEVDALGGAPGIYSARYAGENASDADNRRKLLDDLAVQPHAHRTARFCCVLVLMRHADDAMPRICQGVWPGRIAQQERGANGFGYDSIFLPDGSQLSAAEISAAQKNQLSHRAQALQQMRAQLEKHLGT